jgi:hypothetical protein
MKIQPVHDFGASISRDADVPSVLRKDGMAVGEIRDAA